MQHEVNDLTAALDDTAFLFLQSVQTLPGEIQILFDLPRDNVTIDVPYGRLRTNDPFNHGLALNPGDSVFAVASGLASVCGINGEEHDSCNTLVNPNGLFNWNGPVGIPSPWELTEFNIYKYFEERHKARRELIGVRRDIEQLVFGDENVGVLMGRLGNATGIAPHRLMNEVCVVVARDGGEDRLAFGTNDIRYLNARENGFGSYEVSIVWDESLSANDCETVDLGLPAILDVPLVLDPG